MDQQRPRETIFISHAAPEDNVFATWLAVRLAMAGYKVWCDQQKLIGAEDFWRDIEITLRNDAIKFIIVVSGSIFSSDGVIRTGVGNEIALANIMKTKLDDPYFVISARIDDTSFSEFSIEFLRLNGVDFRRNWASGLDRLIEVLQRDDVPILANGPSPTFTAWRDVHQHLARSIAQNAEPLQSNWFSIDTLPEMLHFYELLIPVKSSEPRAIASSCTLPCTDHGRLLVAFADILTLQASLGDTLPIKLRGSLPTKDFLAGKTGEILGIRARDARNKISSLVRQAWDLTMRQRQLTPYELANTQFAWWFPIGVPEHGQLRYTDYGGQSRRRAVRGYRGTKDGPDGKRIPRYHWHVGFTGKAFLGDFPRLLIQPRIIISEDGLKPLENKTQLNSVRRAVTKMWFNEKWRGLVGGFASWLANDLDFIELDAGGGALIKISSHPKQFTSPISITSDPSLQIRSEDTDDKLEEEEINMRLTDPSFFTDDLEDDESD